MSDAPVLINGVWTASTGTNTFQAINPATRERLPELFPVSPWDEVVQAIEAAGQAARQMRGWPGERVAAFLEKYADFIAARTDALVETAQQETGLAASPRLRDVELPRTIDQLRQAAAAAREGSWALPVIDTGKNIRSMFGPIGPVVVFGPNNFPFAFNGISGGDFAAAIAAGNPVIAKGHSSHPGTTRIFAEAALAAIRETDMPPALVQLIYRMDHADGAKMVGHPLVGASAYTGSRSAGLTLKAAADKAGKPIYLELSSINPVFILSGALDERLEKLAEEFAGSCLMGAGQFCTNPGLVVLQSGPRAEAFIDAVRNRFEATPAGTMLSEDVRRNLADSLAALQKAGAQLVIGGAVAKGKGISHENTLLRVEGERFLRDANRLQAEAFGNSSLFVVASGPEQMIKIAERLEGNLTGTIYSDSAGRDDALYDRLAPVLRPRVGRLLNDKMPTGVAVSPAMNHGGPYPATGHPGFTAVGIPASLRRFAILQCYDNIRPHRLPPALRDKNPNSKMWRAIDGVWTQGDVT